MASPMVKQFLLGNDLILSPKLLGDRLIIDIRQFKSYKDGGKLYPTKEGIFLYLSQYARMRQEIDANHVRYFEMMPTLPMEYDLVFTPAEIGYNGFIQPTGAGFAAITVQSKDGPRTINLYPNQYEEILRQNDEIEASIEAFKNFLKEKQEAESKRMEEEAKLVEEEEEEEKKQAKKKKKVEKKDVKPKENLI